MTKHFTTKLNESLTVCLSVGNDFRKTNKKFTICKKTNKQKKNKNKKKLDK